MRTKKEQAKWTRQKKNHQLQHFIILTSSLSDEKVGES